MTSEIIVESLVAWGESVQKAQSGKNEAIVKASFANSWFTIENINISLEAILSNFLNKEKLICWLEGYDLARGSKYSKRIGLIMAGNIPLVGFHDLLCVLASGNEAIIKLSSKDNLLLPWIIGVLNDVSPELAKRIKITDRLTDFEAIIATGSNNTNRYFEYYFGKFPHIFRKNRNSVAVLTGTESENELLALGKDIFTHFGLGCRNISKLMVPSGYNFNFFFESLESFSEAMDTFHYKNNYDYNRTLLLMNNQAHLASDFLMLVENPNIASPLATLHYEYYQNQNDLISKLDSCSGQIQCIVGNNIDGYEFLDFGKTQAPELIDYADGKDTMAFLIDL